MDELIRAVRALVQRNNDKAAKITELEGQIAAMPTADAVKALVDEANAAQ